MDGKMDGKKKNKKKKSKQNKATEGTSSNSKEVILDEPNKGSPPDENHPVHNSINMDVQSVGLSESDLDLDKQKVNDAQSVGVSESDLEQDKQKIDDVDSVLPLNVKLQEIVKQLEDERKSWLQRQDLKENLQLGLHEPSVISIIFEEKFDVVEKEVNSCVQKESSLEKQLTEFQMRNDSLIQKQTAIDDKFQDIDNIKVSLILKETSLKDMISGVAEANAVLQMQVKELEVSRDNAFEENKRLVLSIAQLESRIECLERDFSLHGHSTTKMNKLSEEHISVEQVGTDEMLENHIAENSELAVKGNEVHIAKDPDGALFSQVSGTELNHVSMSDETSIPVNHVLDHNRKDESAEAQPSIFEIKASDSDADNFVSESLVHPRPLPGLDEHRVSKEIATVPLDEIQIHEDELKEVKEIVKLEGVPLSDAPLIGAPFRLISFVAKYVSGADLVTQKPSKSGK